ncbi:zinc ABC transporter substrate-binding protein [Halomonas sp. 5021]|jgi:zinc transport system substrate-binding protein|uniref:zinc ABC transporter substrate-binding protein n=1 Tax=Halomonas sp. 5021 TaxID=3082156 RepID=UPI002FC6B38B
MTYRLAHYALPLLVGLPLTALADVPRVAVDIPPVHSLVAKVMGDRGSPELFIQPGASPHGYSLRPSEADALDNADLVVWVSNDLTPWLSGPVENLAGDARHLELMRVSDINTFAYREGATFDVADHDHDHDHGHDHAHHHDGQDPHGWMDPDNARRWLDAIAQQLGELDPENADYYRDNAAKGRQALESLEQDIEERLATSESTRFIVFHDAYQYFEKAFDVTAAGAISIGDASSPSPARIEAIQTMVNEEDIHCVFSEPQFNPQIVDAVFGDTDTYIGVMDPLGVDLTPGPELYDALLNQMGDEIQHCTNAM